MKEISAYAAKRSAPAKKAAAKVEIKYTIGGVAMSFREVYILAKKINPDLTTNTLGARLDRGHRDMKILSAVRLPNYRPKGMRVRK